MNTVTPRHAEGWTMSIFALFGVGPRWTITCGSCGGTFKKRLPQVDYPGLQCPYCCSINRLGIVCTTEESEP